MHCQTTSGAQKLKAAIAKGKTEGCEEETAASEEQAEAARTTQKLEEHETAREAARRSGDARFEVTKEETKSAGGVTRSQNNRIVKMKKKRR